MKLMKAATLIIILLICNFSYSQTPYQNLQKYWNYKNRLQEKFMVVSSGNEMGTNIPAYKRVPLDDDFFEYSIHWGDATAELGIYLAVLITEYELLKEFNQPFQETLNELSYALKALERLDRYAEYYFRMQLNRPCCFEYQNVRVCDCYYESDLNGFFIRDDVPYNFTTTWQASHPYFSETPNVHSDFMLGLKLDNGSLIVDPDNLDDIYAKEMSQDQVWNLLPVLALIKKLIDPNVTYTDMTGTTYTMSDYISQTVDRILKVMHGYLCTEILDIDFCSYVWLIGNPATGEVVHRGGSSGDLLMSGGLFAAAGTNITGIDQSWGSFETTLWYPMPVGKYYVDHGQLLLHAVGNDDECSYDMFLAHLRQCGDYTANHLEFAFEHTLLYYMLLFPVDKNYYDNSELDDFIENLLNEAPFNGPFNYGDDNQANFSEIWSGASHYSNPGKGFNYYDAYSGSGEFNGLDYMILHNLYWLTFVQKQPYLSYCDQSINIPEYPAPSGKGSITDPVNCFIKGDVNLTGKYKSNSVVSMASTNLISLKPGFKSYNGAKFSAIVSAAGKADYPIYKKINFESSSQNKNSEIDEIKNFAGSPYLEFQPNSNEIIDNNEEDCILFPNPCKDHIEVFLKNSVISEIYIISTTNIVVHESFNNPLNHLTYNTTELQAGIYLVKIITADHNMIIKKIIKQ